MRKSPLILTLTLLAAAANAGDSFARHRGYRSWGGTHYTPYHYYSRGYYGSGYYHPHHQGYYYNWGYAPSYYYTAPQTWVEPSPYAYTYPAPATQSYYSGPGTIAQPVTITVFVPVADAQVWFEDRPTQQQGIQRVFQSAPLEAEGTYTYTVKARWMENGRPMEQVRQVAVQPGQDMTVDFRSNPGENVPAPRTAPPE